jgi:hypothetical protein
MQMFPGWYQELIYIYLLSASGKNDYVTTHGKYFKLLTSVTVTFAYCRVFVVVPVSV